MTPSAARSGIARRHVGTPRVRLDARFLPVRSLTPRPLAGAVDDSLAAPALLIAYPRRGGVVPGGGLRFSAAPLGCDRRRGAAVAGAGAVDSLHRHPRRYGGPHWPALVCMSRLLSFGKTEDATCEAETPEIQIPYLGYLVP